MDTSNLIMENLKMHNNTERLSNNHLFWYLMSYNIYTEVILILVGTMNLCLKEPELKLNKSNK